MKKYNIEHIHTNKDSNNKHIQQARSASTTPHPPALNCKKNFDPDKKINQLNE